MSQVIYDLAELNKLNYQVESKDLRTLSKYLDQGSSNRVQYLYEAFDGSILEVDIYSTLEGILRKSVTFETFEQSDGFSMEVSVEDLLAAIDYSKGQQPSYKYREQFTSKWEEIKKITELNSYLDNK